MATTKEVKPGDAQVTVRAEPQQIQAWRRAAKKEGRSLASWVRYWLTELAKKAAP